MNLTYNKLKAGDVRIINPCCYCGQQPTITTHGKMFCIECDTCHGFCSFEDFSQATEFWNCLNPTNPNHNQRE